MHPVERLTRHWKSAGPKGASHEHKPAGRIPPFRRPRTRRVRGRLRLAGCLQPLKDSYNVRVVQNPTISLKGDVAATRMIIGQQSEPVILVGHSYGGAVVTEAGNDPKVAALVYIAAFEPDQGESVQTIIGNFPPGSMMPPILPLEEGFLFLEREKMPASFAG
jgi:pimeloyl-ACP methyl ester carboxylesterase